MTKPLMALGLMSGTSMDGVDVALLQSDGEQVQALGPAESYPYTSKQRDAIRSVLGKKDDHGDVAGLVTQAHGDAVLRFLDAHNIKASTVDLIGFHGQTVFHEPAAGCTVQLGDGAALARLTNIDVVNDFRSADVARGGEGAPLAPLYHAALARDLDRPVVIANIGGVSNVTWIGAAEALLSFDTGPGNALLDDWMAANGKEPMDRDGVAGATGRIDPAWLADALSNDYFRRTPPKSLDREDFAHVRVDGMTCEDGAACLTAFTAASLAVAQDHFPEPAKAWYITGGGRRNPTLMGMLADRLNLPVAPVEELGWRGDSLEAEAFAFLAVRSLYGLPLSLPNTTGVDAPCRGGVLHRAPVDK